MLGDIGALIRRTVKGIPSPLLWAVAIFSYGLSLFVIGRHPAQGRDLFPVWTAVHAFLHHQTPYTVRLFVYPPSLLLLASPLGLVGFDKARLVFLIIDAAAMVVAGGLCLRLFKLRVRSTAGAAMLLALALFLPVRDTLVTDNVNGLILVGETGALLAASRNRWLFAGVLLGCTLTVKPVLAPLLLLPLLYRRWTAFGVAVAIPAVLSAAAFPLIVGGGQFFTHTVPFLLNGNASDLQLINVSLAGVATRLELPAALALPVRLLVLGVASLCLWWRWRAKGDETGRLVELSGLILLATFLDFSFSWSYYPLYLLPLLVWMLNRRSGLRPWLTWIGMYCIGGPDVWYWSYVIPQGFNLGMLRITAGCLLLLAAIYLGLRHRASYAAMRRDAVSTRAASELSA